MATLKASFLPDGSVKLEIVGEVDATIHDAVEADLENLVRRLGGGAVRELREVEGTHAEHHHHGHAHVHGRK